MKLHWLLLVLMFSSVANAQVVVRYEWQQPDSTQAHTETVGEVTLSLPAVPLKDGDLSHFLVFLAAGGDTTQVALVPAPPTLAAVASADVPTPVGVPCSVAVAAVDQGGSVGVLSPWSEVLTVRAGPPAASGRPVARAVHLGR